jgi:hypothetical protein
MVFIGLPSAGYPILIHQICQDNFTAKHYPLPDNNDPAMMVMMMTVMVSVMPMMAVANRDDRRRSGRRSLRLAGMGSVLREQRRKIQHGQEQDQK